MASTIAQPLKTPKFKDQYWVKSLKWHVYKNYFGKSTWRTRYLFDRRIRSLTPGDLVIDCGANVGEFTRFLAARGSQVHAFEPCPYAFDRLRENTADLPTVVLHNAAVGATDGWVKLYRTPDFDDHPDAASISSSIYADKINVDSNKFVEVRLINLISFISQLDRRISVLKVDIEGAEVDLLEEMLQRETLDMCDMVFVETHETRIPALAERTEQLRQIARRPEYSNKLFLDWN